VLGAGSAAAVAKAAAPSPADVKQAVDQVNRFMQSSNSTLAFSYDQQAQRIVVKITDSQTGDLIRQIPSEEVLAISQAIGDIQQGRLLRQSA
jgi:flagellar protein FlaG